MKEEKREVKSQLYLGWDVIIILGFSVAMSLIAVVMTV